MKVISQITTSKMRPILRDLPTEFLGPTPPWSAKNSPNRKSGVVNGASLPQLLGSASAFLSSLSFAFGFRQFHPASNRCAAGSLFPSELQRTPEERGKTFRFFRRGAVSPGRQFHERLKSHLDIAVLDFVAPHTLHHAVHEQHWRNPALQSIHT